MPTFGDARQWRGRFGQRAAPPASPKWNNETYGIFMGNFHVPFGEILDAMVSATRVWDAVRVRRRGIEYALNQL